MDAQALTKVWVSAHQSVTQEVQTTLPIVEGELPLDLRGVLYRNGPGRFSIGDQTYGHLFDGDGLVLRFAIGSTSSDSRPRIRYRNRFVRTDAFVHEERAGRMLYRGLGTNLPGGFLANALRLRFKNPANTNVVYHGGRLLALWEGGLPHQLDPVTLDTLGRYDFAGSLLNRSEWWLDRRISPHLPFSAHPKLDAASGELINFGVVVGPHPRLHIYRVDRQGQLIHDRVEPIGLEAFVHDFAITPNWLVFFVYPVSFDSAKVLLGTSTGIDSLRPVPGSPTQVLLLPRNGGPARRFVASPCFVFHFANAFENEQGQVVIDGCRQTEYPVMPPLSQALSGQLWDMPRAYLTRFVIDPQADEGSPLSETPLSTQASEFPRIHPARQGLPHRFIWGVSTAPGTPYNLYTSLVRHDVQTGELVQRQLSPWLPGEAVMVPKSSLVSDGAEDDGYLLSVLYHGQTHRSALHILDARSLQTLCVAQLPHHVPPGFHGNFVPAADCPPGWAI